MVWIPQENQSGECGFENQGRGGGDEALINPANAPKTDADKDHGKDRQRGLQRIQKGTKKAAQCVVLKSVNS